MKSVFYFVLIYAFILLLFSCNINTPKKTSVNNSIDSIVVNTKIEFSESIDNEFTNIYTMTQENGTIIGTVYCKFLNDSVFTDLIVVSDADTLYSINKNVFYKIHQEIDNIGASDDFVGYIFVMKKSDYFTVCYVNEQGEGVSDYATIQWNYETNLLEMFKI